MTTTIPFTPNGVPISFNPTLDGNPYTAAITYNLWGFQADGVSKRPYLNLYTLQGALVICCPLVASPLDYDVSLLPPALRFTSKIIYRVDTGMIEIT